MTSDRPTPVGEGDHDTEVDLPRYDIDEAPDRVRAILPGDMFWPESETT